MEIVTTSFDGPTRLQNGKQNPEYYKAYRLANKDKIIKACRTYYKTHRVAQLTRNKKWRDSNRERFKQINTRRRQKHSAIIRKFKDRPCLDCNQLYPYYVMDFDHRDSKNKSFEVGVNIGRRIELVIEEIKKCDVVCANCHRMRTFKRLKDK